MRKVIKSEYNLCGHQKLETTKIVYINDLTKLVLVSNET